MSWNYTVHQINRSFEQIALWYQEFLRRSEAAFRSLHERVTFLEQQQQASQGPSDEQVERILRKILAERFGDPGNVRGQSASSSKNGEAFFVKPPDSGNSIPRAPYIDPKTLLVDPVAVPSKAYGQTLQLLEKDLSRFPCVEDAIPVIPTTGPNEEDMPKRAEVPTNHGRPW